MGRKKKQTYCLVCRDYNKSIAQHVAVKNLDLLKNKKH